MYQHMPQYMARNKLERLMPYTACHSERSGCLSSAPDRNSTIGMIYTGAYIRVDRNHTNVSGAAGGGSGGAAPEAPKRMSFLCHLRERHLNALVVCGLRVCCAV